ncbi:MAG: 2-amino-4-hydroxy-6-hydroxymethyldihydropteridine diphosphokinase [Candidatus Marinimicrobia bacterium]|nr:2-amino-4-hydroxy-6-hydroxymethyldihydropteridine diphosphokinase [Candidatus Neomarinimicrobiota bacterium]
MIFETAFLGLGSNIGVRENHLKKGIADINAFDCIVVEQVSVIYETTPMYYADQNLFLNQVIQIQTPYSPSELLDLIKNIEILLGRNLEGLRYGPRVLDIDILSYENTMCSSEMLTVPHTGIAERKFVLIPWSDIAPDFIPPGYNLTVAEMLLNIHDQSEVTPYIQPEKVLL